MCRRSSWWWVRLRQAPVPVSAPKKGLLNPIFHFLGPWRPKSPFSSSQPYHIRYGVLEAKINIHTHIHRYTPSVCSRRNWAKEIQKSRSRNSNGLKGWGIHFNQKKVVYKALQSKTFRV